MQAVAWSVALSLAVVVVSSSPASQCSGMLECGRQTEDDLWTVSLLQSAVHMTHPKLGANDAGQGLALSSSNTPSGESNLCIEGFLVPELYTLGCAKCGTTSFSKEVSRSDRHQTWNYEKYFDGHYESYKEHHVFNTRSRVERGREDWYTRHSQCRRDTRMFATDMTPPYLYFSDFVPKTMLEWYGGLASRLKFVVLLREPLARMHSGYYHRLRPNYTDDCDVPETKRPCDDGDVTGGFAGHVELVLKDPEFRNQSRAFQQSLYYPQLTDWFASFDSRQFMIAPFLFQVARDDAAPSIVDYALTSLGLPAVGGPAARENSATDDERFPHQDLDTDLPPGSQLRSDMNDLLVNVTGARLLANLFVQHPVDLFNYTGSPSDRTGIAAWLSDNW